MDLRAEVGGLLARVTLANLAHLRGESLGKLLRDRGVHEQARAGETHLAGVVVLLRCDLGGDAEVGVVHDDRRRLATQLEGQRREVVRCCAGDGLGGGHGAGEADARDARVPRERGPGLGADALDDVEDTGRHAGLSGDLGEEACGERCPLRWLEDDGVTGCECRTDAPGGEHERGIPRRDDRRDAGGIPGDDVGVAPRLELRMLQVVDGVLSEEANVHRHARHDAAAVRAQQ